MRRLLWLIGLIMLALPAPAQEVPPLQRIDPTRSDVLDAIARGREYAYGAAEFIGGYRVERSLATLTGKTADGPLLERRFRLYRLEAPTEDSLEYIRLDMLAPEPVRDLRFLVDRHFTRRADLWVFRPAAGEVRALAGEQVAVNFFGSELSLDDVVARPPQRFENRYIRTEPCGEFTCHVIEQVPMLRRGPFLRRLLWLDTAQLRRIRFVDFNRRDEPVRTVEFSDYQRYRGQFWRAHRVAADNHMNGNSSLLQLAPYRFSIDVPAEFFTPDALSRPAIDLASP